MRLCCESERLGDICYFVYFDILSFKNLENLLSKILNKAAELRASSIAIPALGTGILKFPRKTVAEVLSRCVQAFSDDMPPGNKLEKVKLVAFHADQQTIDAFNELKRLFVTDAEEREKKSFSNPASKEEPLRMRKAPSSTSMDALTMAAGQFKLGNVSLEVVLGDITNESTDCIVVIGNEAFSFQGAVGQAIITKEGDTFQTRAAGLAPAKPGQTHLLKTNKMQTGYVAHVYPATDSYANLKEAMMCMFKKCDKKSLRSVSIPAIGTGNFGKSSKESAKLILHSLADLSLNQTLKNITSVRIVLFEEKMLQEFKSQIAAILENPEKHFDQSMYMKVVQWCKSVCSFLVPGGASEKVPNKKYDSMTTTQPGDSKFNFKSLTMVLYSFEKRAIAETRRRLQEIVDENITPLTKRTDAFKKLTDSQLQKIRHIAEENDVIFVHNKNTGEVTLTGYHKDTTSLLSTCHDVALEKVQEDNEKEGADKLKDYIQWYEIQDDGTKVSYGPILNYKIEGLYKDSKDGEEIETMGDKNDTVVFVMDFTHKHATNKDTKKVLSIYREELSKG